jgi:hypothetical protein
MLLLYAIPAGILLGLIAGGGLHRLAETRFQWAPAALIGLGFQALLFSPPVATTLSSAGAVGPMLYVASTMLVAVVLAANLGQPGFRVILAGATLNLAAILANGGFMPASPEAWAALHGTTGVPADMLTNSGLAGPTTMLAFLGDIFYLPRPFPFANVFSIGDVLIAVGGMAFIARTMAAGGRRRASMPVAQQVIANG